MTAFDLVVAADEAGGIGRDGDLPWRLPGDMAHFRELTTATPSADAINAVIMGRKTWDSIPERFRPLPGRLNIVISGNPDLALPDTVARAGSFDEALAIASSWPNVAAVFVIGGARVYAEALVDAGCRTVHLTRVAGLFDCDTHLPPLPAAFERASDSEEHVDNGVRYRFERWERGARTRTDSGD